MTTSDPPHDWLFDPLAILSNVVIEQRRPGSPKAVAIRLGTVAYPMVTNALRDQYGYGYGATTGWPLNYVFMGLPVVEDVRVPAESYMLDVRHEFVPYAGFSTDPLGDMLSKERLMADPRLVILRTLCGAEREVETTYPGENDYEVAYRVATKPLRAGPVYAGDFVVQTRRFTFRGKRKNGLRVLEEVGEALRLNALQERVLREVEAKCVPLEQYRRAVSDRAEVLRELGKRTDEKETLRADFERLGQSYMDARREREAALRERDEARSENVVLRLGKFAGLGDEEILAEAQRRFPLLGYVPPLPEPTAPRGAALTCAGFQHCLRCHYTYKSNEDKLAHNAGCPPRGGWVARAREAVNRRPIVGGVVAVLSAVALGPVSAMIPGLWAAFR